VIKALTINDVHDLQIKTTTLLLMK